MQHVRKSFRSQAQSCMLQTAQAMERRYTTNLAYDQGDNTGDPALGCRTEGRLDTRYTITVDDIGPRTYTITATAIGDQTNDICGDMTLNQQGAKTPTAGCW
ncbi:MAG: type IV pilin protein [Azonexus sp.]|nr:type IV pilin protein [Azonexus sp.]